MRQYLGFKRHREPSKVDGKKGAVIAVEGRIRHKVHSYAQTQKEEHFRVKDSHLIIGADNAGKSRWLSKLKKEAPHLWHGKAVLAVRSVDSLQDWYTSLPITYRKSITDPPKTTPERIEKVREYLRGGVLLVDDVHRATGRKVDYLHELINEAKIIVVSSTSHHKIHPKLRAQIDRKNPVIHDLYSATAYDATQWAVWIFAVVLLVAGSPEGAILLGSAGLLRGGAKSRNQV